MPRLLTAFAVLLLVGCAHRAPPTSAPPRLLDEPATAEVAEAALRTLTIELAFEGETLSPETAASLQRLAALLREHRAVRVHLGGEQAGTRVAVRAPPRARAIGYGDGFAGTRKRRAAHPVIDEGTALIKLTLHPPEPTAPTRLDQAVSRAP